MGARTLHEVGSFVQSHRFIASHKRVAAVSPLLEIMGSPKTKVILSLRRKVTNSNLVVLSRSFFIQGTYKLHRSNN